MSIKTWTDAQEEELVVLYVDQDIKDVYALAKHFSKGHRSVISKLVQLKVYEKPVSDDDMKNQTVKLMLRDLETMLGIEIEGGNLSKKENLFKLVTAMKAKLNK